MRKAGFPKTIELGQRPALLIIDVIYNFVGDKPEPILKSIEKFPYSCGEAGWRAIRCLESLLPDIRNKGLPTIYSTGEPSLPVTWAGSKRKGETRIVKSGNDIVAEIAPQPRDMVVRKLAPSLFFGTPLTSILFSLHIDTLLVCGGVTSGCVRATVVDAVSYSFRVGVIEECTFDRVQTSHKMNLFDMQAKYARLLSMREAKDYVGQLPGLVQEHA